MRKPEYAVVSVSPSALWISPGSFRGRLDATYYSAGHMRLDDVIAGLNASEIRRLGRFLDRPRRILYMNTETYDEQTSDGSLVAFVSGSDIDGSTASINWGRVKYVDRWMAERYPNGLLEADSLVIKVKGPNQLATYVRKAPFPALGRVNE